MYVTRDISITNDTNDNEGDLNHENHYHNKTMHIQTHKHTNRHRKRQWEMEQGGGEEGNGEESERRIERENGGRENKYNRLVIYPYFSTFSMLFPENINDMQKFRCFKGLDSLSSDHIEPSDRAIHIYMVSIPGTLHILNHADNIKHKQLQHARVGQKLLRVKDECQATSTTYVSFSSASSSSCRSLPISSTVIPMAKPMLFAKKIHKSWKRLIYCGSWRIAQKIGLLLLAMVWQTFSKECSLKQCHHISVWQEIRHHFWWTWPLFEDKTQHKPGLLHTLFRLNY